MREWDAEVEVLIRGYAAPRADYEGLHADEDDLLEAYVRERATEDEPGAKALLRLLDTSRTRWYA